MTLLMSKKLKYFIICFETRCVNQAAEQLYITRSPLARVLYELEDKLGGKLFVRKYNLLEPTELASSLYEKIKPVYNVLCAIENEFNVSTRTSGAELLCDISVPHVIYQYLCTRLKMLEHPITCRRVFVSHDEIQSMTTNPEIILFSFRKISISEEFDFQKFSDESVYLLLPEHISEQDMTDFRIMRDIRLYIRKHDFSSEVKGMISSATKDSIPHINIRETECDMTSLLFIVSAGEGMLLLPECLISYFSPPRTRKLRISGLNIQSGLYVNKRHKNKNLIKNVSSMLVSFEK